ncbi:MAG: putative Ribosomal small subunit methyltransferase [Candidatus Saccharibacteria bacterium]|nr:putative Ribosomal small subunit methyltransferase [Candidatus Saccharibacteria bacterium]
MSAPKKSLGQHWLTDRDVLKSIADLAQLSADDTVLEIGPGLGTLTSELLRQAKAVVAVELDTELARKLPAQFPGKDLTVINEDILTFDLTQLPAGYIVIANVPYYITAKIVRLLMTAQHKPQTTVLLVQKEVAERLAAKPGDMSILAVSAQLYADVTLGPVVPAALFTPPPKVDSQVVVLRTKSSPIIDQADEKLFFRLMKAGFSAKRKKLRSSLAGGLHIDKDKAEQLLQAASIDSDNRAEQLSIDEWLRLLSCAKKDGYLSITH